METKNIIYKNFNNKKKLLNKKKLVNFLNFKILLQKHPLLQLLVLPRSLSQAMLLLTLLQVRENLNLFEKIQFTVNN